MSAPSESRGSAPRPASTLKRDLLKLLCLILAIAGIAAVFALTPALSTSTFVAVVASLFLSPMVSAIERKGVPRTWAIILLFLGIGAAFAVGGLWATQSFLSEMREFRQTAPRYFDETMARLRGLEAGLHAQYPFLKSVEIAASLVKWGEETGRWFLVNGPGLMGSLATCLFVAPLLTFGLLSDGPAIRRKIFELVPNRFFESSFMITSRIMTSLSDYIRAKVIEAALVGLLTLAGLVAIKSPYAVVLAVIAGVTNIIPYAGPIVGAVPGLLIAAFDPSQAGLLWKMGAVYAVANIIDTVIIFPVVVAKLVNLHPILIIILVMLGQQYYGLVGMLISIPIATGIKIVLQEVYLAIYGEGRLRRSSA